MNHINKTVFDYDNIVKERSLTLKVKEDVHGTSNFSFDLNELGFNPNISSDETSQRKSKLFRAKTILRSCLELTNNELEDMANG